MRSLLLRSRGLDETDARNLLINAFAAEINQLPVASYGNALYSGQESARAWLAKKAK